LFAADNFKAVDQACCLTVLYYPKLHCTLKDWVSPSNENN